MYLDHIKSTRVVFPGHLGYWQTRHGLTWFWDFTLALFVPRWWYYKRIVYPIHGRSYNTRYGVAWRIYAFGVSLQNKIATKAERG